mmetsp:Transcript_2270/g.3230  ORF Transcript_2270/g.3230 Transcript_2270/m.3230 type:complete len:204 (-) Transcript_2270:112-723(-)
MNEMAPPSCCHRDINSNEPSKSSIPLDRVTINLGGTLFMTTRETLMNDERTYFAAMLRMKSFTNSNSQPEEFFIDRDPTHFRHILNYLRGNRINLDTLGLESLSFMDELLLEAQYFNINGLCEDLSRRIAEITRKQKEEASGDKDFRLVKCELREVQLVFHEWVIEKNFEFETIQICGDVCFIVLARRVSRGELALVERLMKT